MPDRLPQAETATSESRRRSADHSICSEYDITEARVGEFVASVYRTSPTGGCLTYQIRWRGRLVWYDVVPDPDKPRSAVEKVAAEQMKKLGLVVAVVKGNERKVGPAIAAAYGADLPVWVAMPDQPN